MGTFIKFFNGLLLVMLLTMAAGNVYSLTIQKKCGNFIFQIDISNPLTVYETSHILSSYSVETRVKHIFYKVKPGILVEALCVKDRYKKELFIFHEQYFGKMCNEDIYGIYDPHKRKLLLSPKDWPNGNGAQVEKITGYHFKFLDGDFSSYFCCSEKLGDLRL